MEERAQQETCWPTAEMRADSIAQAKALRQQAKRKRRPMAALRSSQGSATAA